MNFSFQFLSLESYFTLNTISVSHASILLVPLLIANQVLLFLSFSSLSPGLQSLSYYFSSVCTVCHGCSSPWLLNQHLCVKCSFSLFSPVIISLPCQTLPIILYSHLNICLELSQWQMPTKLYQDISVPGSPLACFLQVHAAAATHSPWIVRKSKH